MPIEPAEMLDVLDVALAKAKAKRLRKGKPALILWGRATVLGQTGTWVGEEDGVNAFSYSVRQCVAMREVILEAARADARAAGIEV